MKRTFTEKEKMYMKSNKLCSICGKVVDNNEGYHASKTKRNNYVVAHIECLKRI